MRDSVFRLYVGNFTYVILSAPQNKPVSTVLLLRSVAEKTEAQKRQAISSRLINE